MFVEFRDFNKNNDSEYLKLLHKRINDGLPIDDIIKILKSTDLAVDIYLTGKYEKLYKKAITLIEKSFPDREDKLNRFKSERLIMYTIFIEFNHMLDESGVNEVDRDNKLNSFLISSEKIMNLINRIHTNHKGNINKNIYNTELERYINTIKFNEVVKITDLHENVISAISSVLKYLDYKYSSTYNDINNISDENKSAGHLDFYKLHFTLKNIYELWKYFEVTINISDNHIIEVDYEDEIYNLNIDYHRYINNIRIQQHKELEFYHNKIYNDNSDKLPPYSFWNFQELSGLSHFIGLLKLDKFIDIKILEVHISEWVRAYSLISKLANKALKDNSITLYTISKSSLINELKNSGVCNKSSYVIIRNLTYTKSSIDLMDCPLIPIKNNSYIIVPSVSRSINFSESFISNLQSKRIDLSKRGYNFEKLILKELKDQGVICSNLYTKDNNSEYECDICMFLDGDIFFIEQKIFFEPKTVRSKYEHKNKINEAIYQLKRISDYYIKNKEKICKQLNIDKKTVINNYYKIVLTSSTYSSTPLINNTYIIDHSSFDRFINRDPPKMVTSEGNDKKEVYYDDTYEYYTGKITNTKFIKLLNNQPVVKFRKEKLDKILLPLKLQSYVIKYPIYHEKYPDIIIGTH